MAKWLIPAPVVPGKEGELKKIPEHMRGHIADYEESRKRAGATMERVYAMQTPQGTIVVAYFEGDRGLAGTIQAFATSGLAFDKWFFQKLSEVHGIDFTKPPAGPPPEELFDWADPAVKARKRGLAFAGPIAANKVQKGRDFTREAFVKREAELRESRRKIGGSREYGMLHHTPMGAFACVYLEGDDPKAANAAFARSASPYDAWFKNEAGDVMGTDFNQPLPPIEEIFSWEAKG